MTEPLTAETLVAAGAAPVDVDVNALLAQMQALQARVDSMSIAAGIPTDPIAAAVKDVKDHVNGRVSANPNHDFGEVPDTIKNLSDAPSKDETDLLRTVLDEVRAYEGHEYVKELATKLHKLVLKG